MKRWLLTSVMMTIALLACLWTRAGDAIVPSPQTVLEGTDIDVALAFTDPVTKLPVIPDAVRFQLDRASHSASGTSLIPLTTIPTPASTTRFRIPARLHAMAADSKGPELQSLTVLWEWYPGTCATTFLTLCGDDVDCPDGEACIPHKGTQIVQFATARSRF